MQCGPSCVTIRRDCGRIVAALTQACANLIEPLPRIPLCRNINRMVGDAQREGAARCRRISIELPPRAGSATPPVMNALPPVSERQSRTGTTALDRMLAQDAARPSAVPPPELLLDARTGRSTRQKAARDDLRCGLALWRLALSLGWLDIKLRYRGSLLGPIWLTLSSGVMVAAMGAIYSLLFHQHPRDYLPFLAVSLILWQAGIGALSGEACNSFLGAEQTIRSVRMPFTVQVLRTVVGNVIVLGHNVVVPLVVFAVFGAWPGLHALLALPGFALWILDGAAACYLLGCICARFRDVPPIVGSLMQIAYYVTPVIWKPSQLGARGWWLPLNPFDPLLDVVRTPLLGASPSLLIWGAALGYSALLWTVSWFVFVRARPRLAFWV